VTETKEEAASGAGWAASEPVVGGTEAARPVRPITFQTGGKTTFAQTASAGLDPVQGFIGAAAIVAAGAATFALARKQ
jgi:hypothetical protein